MATKIFPTVNDVGGNGAGKTISELNLSTLVSLLCGAGGFVVSGFTLGGVGQGLDVTATAGTAVVDGYMVQTDTQMSVTCPASQASVYIYLQLIRDASQNVTDVRLAQNTTGVPPADAVLIGKATTSASAITAVDRTPAILRGAGLLGAGASGSARVLTPSGYVDIGPMSTQYSHFATDRGAFHFGKDVRVKGSIYGGPAYDKLVVLEGSDANLVTNVNEINIANGFPGGDLWLNYRGASGAISALRFGNGRATGSLIPLMAAAFLNSNGLPAVISGAPALFGNGSVGDGSSTTINHNLGRIPLVMISSSNGNVGMVLQNVNMNTFTVWNENSGGNTNNFTWYAY